MFFWGLIFLGVGGSMTLIAFMIVIIDETVGFMWLLAIKEVELAIKNFSVARGIIWGKWINEVIGGGG